MSPRVAAAAVIVLGLAAAGCGGDGPQMHGRTAAASHGSRKPAMGWPVARTNGSVRARCDGLPATGPEPQRIAARASAPVVTAIAHTPLLAEFGRVIRAAGLTSRLNSAGAITVFAPEDSAFAALGRGNLTTLLADKSDLARMLKYHVVSGRHTPADLASGKHLTTLLGTVIVPSESRGKYRVNNARIVCGNIQTANATIYIVNRVLVPIP